MITRMKVFVSRVVVMIMYDFGIWVELYSRMYQFKMMCKRPRRYIHKKRFVLVVTSGRVELVSGIKKVD